jgi:large subunit ribosomal protein L21
MEECCLVYAIVEAGGRQHKAEPGRIIKTQKLDAPVGEQVALERVLAFHDGEKLRVGTPYLEGVRVIGRVVQQGRDPKIRVQKFKRKKHYRRIIGHRQPFTIVQVTAVQATGT